MRKIILKRSDLQLVLFLEYNNKLTMPILFKASHKQSGFHGLGLFAEEDIPNGAVWWTM
jgi:hypothetical protein